MNQSFATPLQDRLALATLMQEHKPGDYLVLADHVLLAALDGSRSLRVSEWNALLDSPLTLRRMRVLEAQVSWRKDQERQQPQASHRAVWRASEGQLRAASSSGPFSQASEDGLWMLYSLTTGNETRIALKLQDQAGLTQSWLDARPEVAVLDGEGNTLLIGVLDEDGELRGPWVHDADLRTHLATHGHRWVVEEV